MYHTSKIQGDRANDLKEMIFNLLANAEDPDKAVRIFKKDRNGGNRQSEGEVRSLLRAAGAFAKDNDSYFIRSYRTPKHRNVEEEDSISDFIPSANYLLSFPVPTESRMRVAYSFVQGLFLKYLFQKYKAIPLNVQEGWAELVVHGELPEGKRLWSNFLKSGLAIAAIGTATTSQLVKRNIGKQSIEEEFLSSAYLVGLAQAIAAKPEIFQWQSGGQLHSFVRRGVDSAFKEAPFLLATDEGRKELKKKGQEHNTLTAYGWLVAHGKTINEVEQLYAQLINAVEASIELWENNSSGQRSKLKLNVEEVDSTNAVMAFKESFSKEFLPVVTNRQSLDTAFGGLLGVYLLWELANLKIPPNVHLTFIGWDLQFISSISGQMNSPELQGTLFYMKKGEMGRGSLKIADIAGPLTATLRLMPSTDAVNAEPPFRLYSLNGGEAGAVTSAEVGQVCTICGQPGALSKASISVLPESKRRYYDQPRMVNQADVCSRCVQISILTPFTTDPEVNYALVEVPVDNFLELFALYENLEGLNALNTLKALNRVGSISVFPNRYLMLSHKTSKGSLSKMAQYYLQIAKQSRFLENLVGGKPYLSEPSTGNLKVMSREAMELDISVALLLSIFLRLPTFWTSESNEKAAINRMISSLLKGRPYDSLYAYVQFLSGREDKINEREVFVDGIAGYDHGVIEFYEPKFARLQGGNAMHFNDVRKFSDLLMGLIEPLARVERDSGNTSLSGIARKYTDHIRDFRGGNAAYFLYRLAQSAESLDKRAKDKKDTTTSKNLGKLGWRLKNIGDPDETDPAVPDETDLLFEKELERYYNLYGKNEMTWKSFLKEVEARTLARLMINLGRGGR